VVGETPKPEPAKQEDSGNIIVRDGIAVPRSANPTFGSFSPSGGISKSNASETGESKTGQGCLEDKTIKKLREGEY
jgi:hypothetical protein